MTSPVQVETHNDRIVNTIPSLRIDLPKVDVSMETSNDKKFTMPSFRPRVEIPETTKRDMDSDSSHEGPADFSFLANPKKFVPNATPIIAEVKPANDSDSERAKAKERDSDSDKSHRSNNSNKSKKSDSDYRSRFSAFLPKKPEERKKSMVEDVASNLLHSGIFNTRKSVSAMTEDDIRREKSYCLQQYDTKNRDFMYSAKRLTMNNSLDEIKDELQFITNKKEIENSLSAWKQGLIFFVQGCVYLNAYSGDPFKIDLTDWSREMTYDVNKAGKYDEVLEEIIGKWKSRMPLSPEMKLMLMMGGSLVMGILNKKNEQAQMDKLMAEDRLMTERIKAQVNAEVASKVAAEIRKVQRADKNAFTRHQYREELIPEQQYRPVYRPMQGPSRTNEDILKMMEDKFIDSTIAGDDSSVESEVSQATKQSAKSHSSKKSARSERSRKSDKSKKSDRSSKSTVKVENEEAVTEDKVIRIPNNVKPRGASVSKPVATRGRGRPRKIQPEQVVDVAVNF